MKIVVIGGSGYFRAKLAQEEAIKAATVPYKKPTIVEPAARRADRGGRATSVGA